MKIKNSIKNGGALIIVLFVMTIGCKKESDVTKQSQVDKDPVSAIRSIVGNKGTISILKNQQNFNLSSSKKGEELKDSSLRILSIQEFKKLYHNRGSGLFHPGLIFDVNSYACSTRITITRKNKLHY